MKSISVCQTCGKKKAPSDYLFPMDNRVEVPYCRCIKWATLYGCAELSVINAERLAKDADELLAKAGPQVYEWFSSLTKLNREEKVDVSDDQAARLASSVDYGRLITALSLLILSLQEVGKVALSLDGIRAKKDLDFKKDYQGRFLNHKVRERAAIDLMKKLEFWPNAMDKRSKNLELMRQGSVYVDYSYTFGLWLDPTALGSPEESGTMYSGAVFTGLLEALNPSSRIEGSERLGYLMLGGERFNTFGFAMNLCVILLKTITVLEHHVSDLRSNEQAKDEFSKSIRLAEYLMVPDGLSNEQQMAELAKRLAAITDVLSPAISGDVNSEVQAHFGIQVDNQQKRKNLHEKKGGSSPDEQR